ncbi:MAG: efflux pump, family, rane fusion protein [Acidobacteria bacterium]|nr:efflux pump, family, rane fusion protein [Acidobacteriota bacterium]
MAKRMIIMLLLVGGFVAAIGTFKYLQIREAIAKGTSYQPPPEAVTTIEARREEWPAALDAIGTITAVHGVTVSADLPGVVEQIAFDSGKRVQKGEVLVRLDTSQEEAQLAAALAQENLARLDLERMRGLRAKGITSQAELDRSAAEQEQASARAGEIRATIDRKTIRAPFSGLAGIRSVNLGQYLNSGDPIVSLQSLDPIYATFSVPQQDVGKVRPGAKVAVTAEGFGRDAFAGAVTAVDSVVDEATRNIRVQATLANPELRLRPGMFVTVLLALGAETSSITLPASAVSFAPYGDSVFIVEEMSDPAGKPYLGVRQQFVTLGAARGDQVAVLAGVKEGEVVVSAGAFKLRNGAAVVVNNEIQPGNEAAPKPEDS